ncbi:LysR family transcriptional regulator [Shewanella maritima]|uniref:LysR family transcriptional regulator n=1 Tax=Shewanella maritima TaxID=2520507 RepID=UPI003736700C
MARRTNSVMGNEGDMGQLESIRIFITVVETGSITKASERLGIAKSAVSKRLGELESQLGVKLINRTTRSSSLTEAGHRYFNKSKLIAEELDELNAQLSQSQQQLSGRLKISAPLSFGIEHLTPALDKFCQLHPRLKLEIDFSDKRVNLVEDGIDLALRIGVLDDSSLKAKAITTIRHLLCASPVYLEKHPPIESPADIQQHQFLKYNQFSSSGIPFIAPDNTTYLAPINVHLVANNGDFLKDMAIAGHGITIQPTFIIWRALNSGKLVPLLPDYQLHETKAYVVYPSTRYLPQKSRLLIDFLVDYFGDTPYWDQAISSHSNLSG